MNNEPIKRASIANRSFAERVGAQATRMRKSRRSPKQSIWFGLGMMGIIGWSVVVPTLLGGLLGHWVDKHHASTHSWTLGLLAAGLAIGCLNAWHWVVKEERAIREEQDSDHD